MSDQSEKSNLYSDDELREIISIANKYSAGWRNTWLGHEDQAGTAIERLLSRKKRPENIEAWLKFAIRNLMIDRNRRAKSKRWFIVGLDQQDLERLIIGSHQPSLSTFLANEDFVKRLLSSLPAKDQQLLVLDAAGFSKAEIAEELGYASDKVAATRINQVRKKLKDNLNKK